MTISATTRNAAGISTMVPRMCSMVPSSVWGRGGSLITSPVASETSTCAMTGPYALRQLADGLLEQRPCLVAIFTFPLGIETGGAQLVAERRRIGLIEDEALAGELVLDAGVELLGVGAFLHCGVVNVLG